MIEKEWKRIDLEETGPFVNLNNGYPMVQVKFFDGDERRILVPCFSIGSDGMAMSPRKSKTEDCNIKEEWVNNYKELVEKSCENDYKFFYEFRFGKYIGLAATKQIVSLETTKT